MSAAGLQLYAVTVSCVDAPTTYGIGPMTLEEAREDVAGHVATSADRILGRGDGALVRRLRGLALRARNVDDRGP